jgi:Delta7-sterol 5-desaturase
MHDPAFTPPSDWTIFGSIFAVDFLRYAIPAALAWGLLWVAFRDWAPARRLGPQAPAPEQRRREILYSLSTVAIFALNGFGVYALARAGVFEIYPEVSSRGWAYWWASLGALVIAHDAYFYAVHRLLHRPWWFHHVHAWHHRSVHPSPWAAYAFHPMEAALMAAFLPLVLAAAPLHPGAIFVFLAHMILRNVLGHCGVSLTPRNALGRWYARHFTTTLHHHLHHSTSRGNYGLYFAWLDRWPGSELVTYRQRLTQFFAS